jgi:hypothetical protein
MPDHRPPLLAQRLIELTTVPEVNLDPSAPLAMQVAALATTAFGIVSRDELIAFGMSPGQIARWTRNGRLHRIHPGSYAVGHAALSYLARVMAAQKSIAGDATSAARCAALLLGIYDRGRPVVEMTSTTRHRGLDDVTIRFTRSLDERDVIHLGPLRVTSVARTIVDLAEYLKPHQVAASIYEARRIRIVQIRNITSIARHHRSRHEFPTLMRALDLHERGSAGTRSPAEDDFLDRILAAGLPEPLVNVHVHVDRRKYELDFHWPEYRLNIEVDGGEHELPERRAKDEERDARLRAAGWTVVRIPPSFLEAGVDIVRQRAGHSVRA